MKTPKLFYVTLVSVGINIGLAIALVIRLAAR